jgi:hypothetical protein
LTRVFERVENGKIIRDRSEPTHSESRSIGVVNVAKYLTQSEDLLPIQILFKREAMSRIGKFDPAFEVHEDREFLIRFLDQFDISVFDRKLAFHHVRISSGEEAHTNSMSGHDAFRHCMNLLDNRMARGTVRLKNIDQVARQIMVARDVSGYATFSELHHPWRHNPCVAAKFIELLTYRPYRPDHQDIAFIKRHLNRRALRPQFGRAPTP